MEHLTPEELAEAVKTLYQEHGPLCDSEGFYNHEGECWNDSLQMLFLNSDFCKEKVQSKLASGPIDPFEVEEKFLPYAQDRLKDISNNEVYVRNFIGYIYTYLETLQSRFYRHYYAEHLRLSRSRVDDVCTLEDFKGREAMKQMTKLSLLYRAKGKEGTLAGYLGQNIRYYDLNLVRDPSKMKKDYISGGTYASVQNVMNIFSTFFDLPLRASTFRRSPDKKSSLLFDKDTNKPFRLNPRVRSLYVGTYTIGEKDSGHALSFYTCGNRDFFYDDRKGSIEFPWRFFFDTNANETLLNSVSGIYCDGTLEVRDSSGSILFSYPSYPYMNIEKTIKKNTVSNVFLTYLWDKTPIYVDSMKTQLDMFTFEKKIGSYTATFTFEPPKNPMNYVISYESETPFILKEGKSNQQSGTFLGARIHMSNELRLENQLDKVKQGKAKIDDYFFYDDTSAYTPLLYAIRMNDINSVKQVLEMGASISRRGKINESPFFFAVVRNPETDIKILTLLLENGADINDNDNYLSGFTPLMGSIIYNDDDRNLEHIEFLLKNGADIQMKSKQQGATAIEYAFFYNKYQSVQDILIQHGAVPPICPPVEKLLKAKGIMNEIRKGKIIQAGILARCYREKELFDELNSETMLGETPLKLALQLKTSGWSNDLIDFLLWNGSDVNYVDRGGLTPLYFAISLQKTEFVEQLLNSGAKWNVTVKGLGTPLEYAEKIGNPDIIALLKEKPLKEPIPLLKKSLPTGSKPTYTFKKRPIRKPTASMNGGKRKTRKH